MRNARETHPDLIDGATAWLAVLHRDRRYDGCFVYAVSSTHIFCRPSCPSRRPARRRVRFFPSPQQAEAAGFRACLRCRPGSPHSTEQDERIEQARRYLDAHADEPVTLRRLAGEVGLSPFHLQRVFQRSIGLSPKAYQDARRIERFSALLKRGERVTTAIYAAGFSSSSRVAERMPEALGMTPSAYRSGGRGVTLRYATVRTPVGRALIAKTERGVASISLGDRDAALIASLKKEYPLAMLQRDQKGLAAQIEAMQGCLDGRSPSASIALDLRATDFQRKVWTALSKIPCGSTRTYREIAREIGQPSAVRAVARACETNSAAILIPCHRVIRENGRLAGYRWGLERKQALLALERERQES